MKVKIVAISDTHRLHDSLTIPECDVLIHAGDASNNGSETEVMQFLEWFDRQPATFKFFVPGNHDAYLFKYPIDNYKSVKLLYGQQPVVLETLGNLKIFGTPGVLLPSPHLRQFRTWSFGGMEDELEERWSKIPVDTDILVTHNPPYGILDTIESGKHVGSRTLMKAVQGTRAKLHIFGHIHEAGGAKVVDKRHFINAAILGHYHDVAQKPSVIEMVVGDE